MDSFEEYSTTIGVPAETYIKALIYAIKIGYISSPMLQKELSIPYHISAMVMDLFELDKVISEDCETGERRKVIVKQQ